MAYNRYINKFPTNVEFDKYIKGGLAEVPNTALIDDTGEMKYTRKLPNDYIFYGTTKGTTDFMIGRSVSSGTADCIKVHVVPSTDGSDNKMYANKEDIVKTPVKFSKIDTGITSVEKWKIDTSSVTNMNNMFRYCESLTSLDLSSFDTSSVTDMDSMFEGCNSLTSLTLTSSFFNSSAVTEFDFSGLTSWTETTSLSQFVNAISSKDGTGKTVKLSDATKTALTDAQKKQITDAKWTIA